jgi:hypothetical protein
MGEEGRRYRRLTLFGVALVVGGTWLAIAGSTMFGFLAAASGGGLAGLCGPIWGRRSWRAAQDRPVR